MKIQSVFLITIISSFSMQIFAGMDEARKAYDEGNYELSMREASNLANKGNADAQNFVGVMYSNGEGVEKNINKAFDWFVKSANQGNPKAQSNLANCYENGEGAKKDLKKAAMLYLKAASQGFASAQDTLGYYYSNGMGVKTDHAQAVNWFRKAAEQNLPVGQYNLAVMYQNGQGVAKDDDKAIEWFKKAADQGYLPAQNKLESMKNDFNDPSKIKVLADNSISKNLGIDGAIICNDYDTLKTVIYLYQNYAESQLRVYVLGEERELLMHGKTQPPNIENFGCNFFANGTSMMWNGEWMPALVSAKLPNGKIIKGVTEATMFKKEN